MFCFLNLFGLFIGLFCSLFFASLLSVSFFLYLSPLSLCLSFHVSLCVSFSPPQLSPRLPSLSLSLSTVKKAKFDGAQGKWLLFLSSPVLYVCLSVSWRDGRGCLSQGRGTWALCLLSITEHVRLALGSQQSSQPSPEDSSGSGAHPEPMVLPRILRDRVGTLTLGCR